MCLSQLQNNKIDVFSPLYFNIGINDYRVTLDKIEQLKLIKLCLREDGSD